jgi:hypothetical protein
VKPMAGCCAYHTVCDLTVWLQIEDVEMSLGSRIVVRSRWAESDFCCCRDRLRMETVSVGERLSDVKSDHSSL